MDGPVIEHWLVTVARAAGLDGVADLHVPSDTPAADAWDLVAMAARVSADDLVGMVARHHRLPVADLQQRDPHVEKLVPAAVARRLHVIPLRYTDRALVVASSDPVDMEAERELIALAARTVSTEIARPGLIREALTRLYPDQPAPLHELPRLMPEDRGGPHVLVVDDDADARLRLRAALEGRGFRVSEADDGTTALALLDGGTEAVHLVTLDLQMRELHGLDTLRRMRGTVRTAHIPVIVATGADDSSVEMELFAAGADDYVVKPIDPPRFVLRVQAVLRRRGGPQPPVLL